MTDSLSSAPAAFSNNADQGFKNLSGPSANGDDLANPTGGANDGDTLRIEPNLLLSIQTIQMQVETIIFPAIMFMYTLTLLTITLSGLGLQPQQTHT